MTVRPRQGTLIVVQAPWNLPGRQAGYALASLALGLLATACAGEIDDAPSDAEAERLHLGRVHVLLEPGDETEDGEPAAFEVTARFAYVRGFDEDVARARIDMAVLPHDSLRVGECVPSDHLAVPSDVEAEGDVQELVLLDAGDLQVRIGGEQLRVPLSLVPDLLPYMSGVEYLYYGNELPEVDGAPDLAVTASGSVTDELPPFRADGIVPKALGLGASPAELGALDQDALALHWQEAGDDVITLRIVGLTDAETTGTELTCVLEDRGAARLDLGYLRARGLSSEAASFQVTASRLHTSTFDAGDFAGSELVIEHRETLTLR